MDIIHNWRPNFDKYFMEDRIDPRVFMHDRSLSLFAGLISGVVAWIFDRGFEAGFHVGIYIGALYALYCIGRIISPNITIEVYTDGTTKVLSERWNGIIGLIVLLGAGFLAIFG